MNVSGLRAHAAHAGADSAEAMKNKLTSSATRTPALMRLRRFAERYARLSQERNKDPRDQSETRQMTGSFGNGSSDRDRFFY